MTLADTPTSQRKSLPSFVRRLAITLVVALVATAAICVCRLTHRPVGYSGNARISSFISPDFASGFDVAWEMTASELGVSGQLYSHAKVDDTLVAIFKDKDQPPTLVAIDLRGTQPSVLWHRELAESSAPILTWDDSIIVDGQTIRVYDGQVTATWESPIPDSVTSGSPLLYVGQDLDRSEKMSFVAVQWPVAVVCYPSDRPRMFQDSYYICVGHNKDGTKAWRYAADVRDDSEKPGIPMNVPMANGYVPTKHSINAPGAEANRFLNLLDGSVTEPVSADFTTLTPVTDGWAFSGTMADDSEAPALVTITANGTEISRIPLTDNAIRLRGADTIRCWDETGQTITPTSEQLATTLISGEVTWAHLCTHADGDAYPPRRITAINGRRLYVTNEAGGADRVSYPSTAAISTDGSLILSTPPTHDDREEPAPPETLYAVPSGIPLTSLDEIGATDASVFYDDLLIASPTRSDSWSARLRSFLGFYPHQDTVLMGITPKRAS